MAQEGEIAERVEHYKRTYLSNLSPAGNIVYISDVKPNEDDKTLEWLETNCLRRIWNQLRGPGQKISFFLHPEFKITTWYSPYANFDRRQIYVERHLVVALGNERKIPQNLADFLESEKFQKVED